MMVNKVQHVNHYAIAADTLLSIRKAYKPIAADLAAAKAKKARSNELAKKAAIAREAAKKT